MKRANKSIFKTPTLEEMVERLLEAGFSVKIISVDAEIENHNFLYQVILDNCKYSQYATSITEAVDEMYENFC